MKDFNRFVNEIILPASIAQRALRLFELRLKQKVGKIYRYGGPDGIQELDFNGIPVISYLYFTGSGKAIRINTIGGTKWLSVHLWKRYDASKPADLSADLSQTTKLAPVIDDLIDRLRTWDKKDIVIYFPQDDDSAVIGESLVTEAKRTTVQGFYDLAKSFLKNQDMSAVLWTDVEAVAKQFDVQVPFHFRGQKVSGKGTQTRYNLVPPGTNEESGAVENPVANDTADKKGASPILYIKVTAQDPETKRFLPAGENEEAQRLYRQIQTSLRNDPAPDRERKDPTTLFGRMVQLTDLVARGKLNSLLIAGGPGIGKTFDVFKTIKAAGLSEGTGFAKFSGTASPISIYQTFFKWRKGGLIVFDDLDSIWGDKDSTNLLKAALDSYETRTLTWMTSRTTDVSKMTRDQKEEFFDRLDQEIDEDPTSTKIKYPSQFTFEGQVIFISNLPFEKFDTAILSRSAKIDMTLTQAQVFERMRSILQYLGDPSLSLSQKEEIVDYLETTFVNQSNASVTLREFVKGSKLVASGVPNWRDLLEYM